MWRCHTYSGGVAESFQSAQVAQVRLQAANVAHAWLQAAKVTLAYGISCCLRYLAAELAGMNIKCSLTTSE